MDASQGLFSGRREPGKGITLGFGHVVRSERAFLDPTNAFSRRELVLREFLELIEPPMHFSAVSGR